MSSIHLFPVPDLPLIQPGDRLAALIVESLARIHEQVQATDIIVIAQNVVARTA